MSGVFCENTLSDLWILAVQNQPMGLPSGPAQIRLLTLRGLRLRYLVTTQVTPMEFGRPEKFSQKCVYNTCHELIRLATMCLEILDITGDLGLDFWEAKDLRGVECRLVHLSWQPFSTGEL